MSWNKPVWTVEEIRDCVTDIINRGGVGKDLYIAGIPRGRQPEQISAYSNGSKIEVTGSGIICGFSTIAGLSYPYSSAATAYATGTLIVDEKQTFTTQATHDESGNTTSVPVVFDTTRMLPSVDISADKIPAGAILNCGIRFEKGFKLSVTASCNNSYGTGSGTATVLYFLG